MEEHDDFRKEWEGRPKGADNFLIVIPWDLDAHEYKHVHYDYERAEGILVKEDVKRVLNIINGVPTPVNKGRSSYIDAVILLVVLIGLIWIAISAYFCHNEPFEGLRAASLIISCCFVAGVMTTAGILWFLRAKNNKNRVEKLQEAIERAQNEILSPKGAILTISPLESHLIIEMCWKYSRLGIYGNFEDASEEVKSLTEFNKSTVETALSNAESRDPVLFKAIVDNARKVPESKFIQLVALNVPAPDYEELDIEDNDKPDFSPLDISKLPKAPSAIERMSFNDKKNMYDYYLKNCPFHKVDTDFILPEYVSIHSNSIGRHLASKFGHQIENEELNQISQHEKAEMPKEGVQVFNFDGLEG